MVPGLLGGEGLDRTQVGEELAAVDELQYQVEVFGVLGQTLESER
jgi:hypothetical protein